MHNKVPYKRKDVTATYVLLDRQERMCGRKIRHPTRELALAHRADLRRKDRAKLSVYFCNYCGAWHVGHKTKGRTE